MKPSEMSNRMLINPLNTDQPEMVLALNLNLDMSNPIPMMPNPIPKELMTETKAEEEAFFRK